MTSAVCFALPLLKSFADAKDRSHAVGDGSGDLARDQIIAFVKDVAAFRVTEND